MSKRALIDGFLNQPDRPQLYRAEVLEVADLYCNVRLLQSDLEVEMVSLTGEEDAENYVVVRPRVGSLVLVGCVELDDSQMFVAQAGDIESIYAVIGDTKIDISESGVSLTRSNTKVILTNSKATVSQSDTAVELGGGKVSVTNGTLTLKGLFDDLATLLNSFVVLTAQGPSTGLGPNSITAITNLKTKVSQLLK